MLRRIGFLAFVAAMAVSMALPAWCENSHVLSGAIAGYVRDSNGLPQMGAAVEIVGSAARVLKVFSDDRGFYFAASLIPGSYSVKVSAPSFLPSLREKIDVRGGAKALVNVTLTTLFEAIQLVPLRGSVDDDDWKWTLRSVSNRPILRVLEDGSTVVASAEGADHNLKGTLTLMGGSPGQRYGTQSDMSAGFDVERSVLATGTLRLNGNLGYGTELQGMPAAVLRTSYTNRFNGVFEPTVSVTAFRLNSPDRNAMPAASLQALSLTSTDRIVLGDRLEVKVGSEFQTIQFMGRAHAFKPFGSADFHVSPNTVLEYQFASSIPGASFEDEGDSRLESGVSQLSDATPRMSIANFAPAVERGRHHEISLSHRAGKNNMQVAFFSDSMSDPVLAGVGDINSLSGEILPDLNSGTFSYQGNNYSTSGMRVVVQRKLLSDLNATLDYAYGGSLDLNQADVQLGDARNFIRTERHQSVAAKFSGTLPKAKTRWMASYRHSSGRALTPVDEFNSSAGRSEPFLNICLRQPIPANFLAGHMEILMDLRNLLAQGYVPVMGTDGQTVYLVQSARSVRGGVAFNF